MFEIKLNVNKSDKIEYDPQKGKTECQINNKIYHVYQIRSQNPLTYLGYFLRLIFRQWKEVSYKGNKILVKKEELSAFQKDQRQSSQVKEHFFKAVKANLPDFEPEQAEKMTKILYKHMIKNPLESGDKPQLIKNPDIKAAVLLTKFDDKSISLQFNKELGKGSYKEVFDGYQFKILSETETSIKFKFAPAALLKINDIKYKQETIRENQIASKFTGSHVVKESKHCFNTENSWVMVSDKLPFFFENVISRSLFLPAQKEKRTFEYLIRGAKGAAKGIAEIHKEGYVHRDIKPANLAIQANGKGMATDLGTLIGKYRFHTCIGTPLFLPPELIKRVNINCTFKYNSQNAQGDLWAFGLSLYEIFHPTNQDPPALRGFGDIYEKIYRIQQDPIAFKKDLFQDWPAANEKEKKLQDTIRKLLSVNPKERGTAQEAYESLRAIQKTA